jgi:hypothetical protein
MTITSAKPSAIGKDLEFPISAPHCAAVVEQTGENQIRVSLYRDRGARSVARQVTRTSCRKGQQWPPFQRATSQLI